MLSPVLEAGPALFVLVAVLGAAGAALVAHRRRRRKAADMARLLARDRSLAPTARPCGLDPAALASRYQATPRGDRRYGLEYGVGGPVAAPFPPDGVDLDGAAFRWWWEVRRRQHTKAGSRTTYERLRTTVALARLPVPVPDHIVVRPESALGRVGLTRGGHQFESSEFNRRFRVEARDRALGVMLLDAGLQELLATHFVGRTVELVDDLVLLAGRPDHRDPTLTGVIGELPAVRQDLGRLLRAVPAAFWRSVGVTR